MALDLLDGRAPPFTGGSSRALAQLGGSGARQSSSTSPGSFGWGPVSGVPPPGVRGPGGLPVGSWWGPRGAGHLVAGLPAGLKFLSMARNSSLERQKFEKKPKTWKTGPWSGKLTCGGKIPWGGGKEAAGPLEYRPGRKHTHTVTYPRPPPYTHPRRPAPGAGPSSHCSSFAGSIVKSARTIGKSFRKSSVRASPIAGCAF